MNKIVTIVIVVVAALIAVVAALPYWFGMQAESAYEALLQKMTTGGELTVSSNNFQRGWFESTADTTFTLANLPTVTVSMLHRISHGPLPLDDDFQLQPLLARVKSQISISLPGGAIKLPPMTGKTSVYLAGNSSTRLDMQPYKKAAPKAGEADTFDLEWKGMGGDFTLSADYKNLKGELNAPVLQFSFKDGSFALNKISLSMDTQEGVSGLGTGSMALGVDKLVMDDRKKGESISLDGLRLSTNTQEVGSNLNSTLTFQFRGMESGSSKQGADDTHRNQSIRGEGRDFHGLYIATRWGQPFLRFGKHVHPVTTPRQAERKCVDVQQNDAGAGLGWPNRCTERVHENESEDEDYGTHDQDHSSGTLVIEA